MSSELKQSRRNASVAGMQGLPTARQMEALAYIRAYQSKHGVPPTVRRIGEALGIASTNAVLGHLKSLHKKGQLLRTTRGTSTIYLAPGEPALAVEPSSCPHCGKPLAETT